MPTKIQKYAQQGKGSIQRCIKHLGLDQLNSRILIVYLLNIMDLVFTTAWVFLFGVDIEGNPIGKWLYQTNGIYVFKTIGVAVGLYFLNKYLPKNPKFTWTTWALMLVYGAIDLYHLVLAIKLITIFV